MILLLPRGLLILNSGEDSIHASSAPRSMQAKIWASNSNGMHRMQHNDWAMSCWVCHLHGPSQLARSPGQDAARRSGKSALHRLTQMTWLCQTQ